MTPEAPYDAHRTRVWLGLTLAVALDSVVPLLWKAGVMRLPSTTDGAALLQSIVGEPRFWLLLVLFGVQFINWMAVLAKADVSYAQPITALSYVTVSAGSHWLMGEGFTVLRGVAVGLILAGVWLIGMTPVRTTVAHHHLAAMQARGEGP